MSRFVSASAQQRAAELERVAEAKLAIAILVQQCAEQAAAVLLAQRLLFLAEQTAERDGIVCGHIHRGALIQRHGLVYANDGDWVESLTALVEEADGRLRLLSHRGEVLSEVMPRLLPASPAIEPLPKAA